MTTTAPSPLLDDAVRLCQQALIDALPDEDAHPQRLHAAMHYSLMGGGKRVRPALVLGACRAVGGADEACLPAMAAVEILHTYTLVHDDLPAMDDDDLRRGRATVHKVWDEATAILVGDALNTLAFACLAQLPATQAKAAVAVLASAAGSEGVIGGQQDDLDAEGGRGLAGEDPAQLLQRIHARKTAALIRASCQLGAICGQGDGQQQAALADFGFHIGLAFQIIDDLLDQSAAVQELGKTPGKDAQVGKLTWVSVHGLEAAQRAASAHTEAAEAALAPFGAAADGLRALAALLLRRNS
ncbi:MAG: polyprenyl synthetase family protein [Planctomycetota bacterium]|nr:MAG: polyprenyl synthetase family protein [Planctomycetota bacterium]